MTSHRMSVEPLAYLNGRLIPHSQAVVPVSDAGFVLGVTVAEQLRTFGGQLFRLPEHLARLEHSLAIVGVKLDQTTAELARIAQELASVNHQRMAAGDDLGLAIFVTPGEYATLASSATAGPTLCMHTYPLPFRLWADKYRLGQSLVTTDVQQVPRACWPTQLKCRSRMHYYLADRQAAAAEPGARALLLDGHGHVTETTTTNVILYRRDVGLLVPPSDEILPGISLSVVRHLAHKMQIPLRQQVVLPADVAAADELLLSATTTCLLPAVRFNGQAIGSGQPGPIFERLIYAWNDLVGLDIRAQAVKFASRAT